jgi:hypothetical protein
MRSEGETPDLRSPTPILKPGIARLSERAAKVCATAGGYFVSAGFTAASRQTPSLELRA